MKLALYLASVLSILGLAAWGGYTVRDGDARAEVAKLQAEWDAERLRLAQGHAAKLAKAITIERQWREKQTEVLNDAQDQLRQARADRDVAYDVSRRLRDELARANSPLGGFIASGAGITLGGPTAGTPRDVLIDLFLRADDAAGELAAHADEARTAGLACERAYDALTRSTGQ